MSKHRDSKGENVFRQSHHQINRQSYDTNAVGRSYDRGQNSPLASSHKHACLITGENVEPMSPSNVNESIDKLQPSAAIDIYVDRDSPVIIKSAHFAKQPDTTAHQ